MLVEDLERGEGAVSRGGDGGWERVGLSKGVKERPMGGEEAKDERVGLRVEVTHL